MQYQRVNFLRDCTIVDGVAAITTTVNERIVTILNFEYDVSCWRISGSHHQLLR